MVNAFVASHIDYYNSLLYAISDYNINNVQPIQNTAAHKVTNAQTYDHITPILYKLHWLSVRQHNHVKILLIMYKCMDDIKAEYLCELVVSTRKVSRKLRSCGEILLQVAVS